MHKIFLRDTKKEVLNATMLKDGSILICDNAGYHVEPKEKYLVKEYPVPCLEQFKNLILAMQKNDKKHDKLNAVLNEVCMDSILWFPTLKQEILDYLKYAFGDENDWIGYYVCELNYGKEWVPGTVTDHDGSDIKLQTIEELYSLLIANLT